MPSNCLSNISHKFLKRFLAILDKSSRNFVKEMKLLYWAPYHPTFHLLNWSLGRNFQDIWDKYVVEEGEFPGLVASISIPPTGWWLGGGGGEGGGSQLENC